MKAGDIPCTATCADCGARYEGHLPPSGCTKCGSTRRMVVGVDLSDGIETTVVGFFENGILHITDIHETIEGTASEHSDPRLIHAERKDDEPCIDHSDS